MEDEFDFSPFAVGGALRPDTFSGLSSNFRTSLGRMLAAAPLEIQQHLRVSSGYRSPDRQAQLWQQALNKYGSESAARKWVAPPGRSLHNHGEAVDLKYLSPEATKWAHENAGQYGLHFPLSNENWHIEPVGARGGGKAASPTMMAQAQVLPAQAAGGVSPLAQLFSGSEAIGVGTTGGDAAGAAAPAMPALGQLALMFGQQQNSRQQAREKQQADERARRAALFNPQGLFGIYG